MLFLLLILLALPVYAGQMEYDNEGTEPVSVPSKEVEQVWFDASSNIVIWEIHLFNDDGGHIIPGFYLDELDCIDAIEYVHFLYKDLADRGEMTCLDEHYPSDMLTFE